MLLSRLTVDQNRRNTEIIIKTEVEALFARYGSISTCFHFEQRRLKSDYPICTILIMALGNGDS